MRRQHHDPTRVYIERRTVEGKSRGDIIRCLTRYVIREVYHLITANSKTGEVVALLTQASLYWFTNSIESSFRLYYEYKAEMTSRVNRVDVPTALAVFVYDLTRPPRSWAERTYAITRYTTMPSAGHFAPHEEPELLTAHLTEFFRPLR